jgi:hypothetical protein
VVRPDATAICPFTQSENARDKKTESPKVDFMSLLCEAEKKGGYDVQDVRKRDSDDIDYILASASVLSIRASTFFMSLMVCSARVRVRI